MSSIESSSARAVYEAWHPRVQSNTAEANRPWHKLLFRHVGPHDLVDRRVLEIGCGRGELVCHLARFAAAPRQLIAADFAQSAIQLGRERAHRERVGRVFWMVSDIQHVALQDALFDTVISCETIEHLPDPVGALRELHRVLRPGGCLVLTTPNYLGPLGLYRGYLRLRGRRYTEGDQPITRLTLLPRTLMWMYRAGFRVRTVDAAGHYLLRPGHLPSEPAVLKSFERWLWPFGLHSIVVAEKLRRAEAQAEAV